VGNYRQEDARYTMILVRDGENFRRHGFDLVRFNVDDDADAKENIVPVGATDHGKIFERIWKVDSAPFGKKQRWEG